MTTPAPVTQKELMHVINSLQGEDTPSKRCVLQDMHDVALKWNREAEEDSIAARASTEIFLAWGLIYLDSERSSASICECDRHAEASSV